jgi:hypothetical protein
MAIYYASASNGRQIELIRVAKADQSGSVRHEIVALFPLTKLGQLNCNDACESHNLDLLLVQQK